MAAQLCGAALVVTTGAAVLAAGLAEAGTAGGVLVAAGGGALTGVLAGVCSALLAAGPDDEQALASSATTTAGPAKPASTRRSRIGASYGISLPSQVRHSGHPDSRRILVAEATRILTHHRGPQSRREAQIKFAKAG
jgi:hypothetical protein